MLYIYISSLTYPGAIFTDCDTDKVTTQINLKIKEIRNNRCTVILTLLSDWFTNLRNTSS